MRRIFVGLSGASLLLVNTVVGLLLAFVGLLGVDGRLADTSLEENRVVGLMSLAATGVPLLNTVVLFSLSNTLLRGHRYWKSGIVRGLACLGNMGFFLVGTYLCWYGSPRPLLFDLPLISLLMWSFAVANVSIIGMSHWAMSNSGESG